MGILIKNALVVSQDRKRSVRYNDVLIEGNVIAEVSKKIRVSTDRVIDGTGKLLMPGLVNTHTHVAMGRMRGLVDDVPLGEFLSRTSRLDSKQTGKTIRRGAELGINEMIRTGTTTFVDLYYSEDIIASAAAKSGMRAFLSWVALDKKYTTQKGDPLENAERFIRNFRNKTGLVVPGIGLQGVYVCGRDTILKAKEIAEKYDCIVPMHVSESISEISECKKRTGATPISYLEKIGALHEKLIAVHAVYASQSDIRKLRSNNVSVSHNPTSNMKLGNGFAAPVTEMAEGGINVSLGTDSVASNNGLDMFGEMKAAALLQKAKTSDPTALTAQQSLDMATLNGAKAIGMAGRLGSIQEGMLADVVLLDPAPNGLPLTPGNAVSNIVYALNGLNACATIINGKIAWQRKTDS